MERSPNTPENTPESSPEISPEISPEPLPKTSPTNETEAPLPQALPRPLLPAILRVFLYALAVIALQVAIGAPIFAALTALGFSEPSGAVLGSLLLLNTTLQLPFVLALTAAFLHYLDRRPLTSIGLVRPTSGRWGVGLTTLGTLALLGLWLAVIAPGAEVEVDGLSAVATPEGLTVVALLLVHLVGFLIQGGLEELMVRGYAYRALRERYGVVPANLSTSLVFALLHAANPSASPVAIANTFLAGVVFAALVERTQSLVPAVIAHGVWNFTIACVLSVPISGIEIFHLLDVEITGPAAITGGAYGPEGSWLIQPMLLLVLWGVGRSKNRRHAAS
jgi:uncharacterized protein